MTTSDDSKRDETAPSSPEGPNPTSADGTIDRRRFLTYLVAGPTLVVASRFVGLDGLTPSPANAQESANYNVSVIEITPDNRIRVKVERLEFGQGIATVVGMMVAEELGAHLDDIDLLWAPAGSVGGSGSVRGLWSPVRSTAARARAHIVTAAAERWGVAASSITTEDTIAYGPDGQSATFGELSAAAAAVTQPAVPVTPKPYSEHRVIGQPTTKMDVHDIVTGRATYALDLDVPGALATVVARAPTINGTVATLDDSAARAMEGVVAITQIPTGVAVSATTFYHAMKARDALEITWLPGPTDAALSDDVIRAELTAMAPAAPVDPSAGPYLEGTFEFNFVSHSPMEPFEAIADVRADRADVWSGNQAPGTVKNAVATATGLPAASVTVHQQRAGGGFGSRIYFSAELEAAQVSQAIGQPVKLLWSRHDTVRHGWMRPSARHQVRVSHSGGDVVWNHYLAGVGIVLHLGQTKIEQPVTRAGLGEPTAAAPFGQLYLLDMPYEFESATGASTSLALPMHTGFWRGVHAPPVATCREVMVDELATAMGVDPVALRMERIGSDRGRAVLEKVVTTGNWGRDMPPGCAQGVAYHEEFGSLVACLVEIDATDPQAPRVTKAVLAANVGRPLNPRGIEAQLMGAAENGIAVTLQSGLHIEGGTVQEGTFGEFHWTRQKDNPVEWDLYVFPGDGEPGGVGELGISPACGAVANAYARATGTKPRKFPITNF